LPKKGLLGEEGGEEVVEGQVLLVSEQQVAWEEEVVIGKRQNLMAVPGTSGW